MWTFLSGVIFGLLASCRSDQLQVNSRSCSFAGVFLAEGASRHSLNFDNAEKMCQQLETVMASAKQLKDAYNKKMETCRNGWIQNLSIAILRHKSHEKCANNMTGLIIHSQKTADELFDVYCYDEQAGPEKNCTKRFQSNANFNSPAPAEPDAATIAGSKEQLEPTPTPWNAGDSESGHSTEPTGDNALDKTMTTLAFMSIEPSTASREDIETNSFEGNGNSGVGSNFTMDGLDPSAGSGMQLEEEEAITLTPADVPQESLGENEQSSGETKEEDRAATGQPNDDKQILPSDQKDSDSSSDWLIVIVVIVAVAAILLVCTAVAKRKSWCGRQKTLVITSKDGSEGNGAAAASSSHNQEREQEMVTLMNKENIQENGNTEEFTVITLEESPDKDQQA